ncbi:MAG: hypothetical protein HN623_12325, partial [Bdellovibrionales bacterium]|nr:hypothetical protein [Bdellovibrionales bacterium]
VDNVMLFKLAVGSEFEVVRSAQSVGADWMMIKMFDGKKGWIHRQQVVVSTQ